MPKADFKFHTSVRVRWMECYAQLFQGDRRLGFAGSELNLSLLYLMVSMKRARGILTRVTRKSPSTLCLATGSSSTCRRYPYSENLAG